MKYNIVIDNMNRAVTSGSLSDVVERIDYTVWVTASKDDNIYHFEKLFSFSFFSASYEGLSSNFLLI